MADSATKNKPRPGLDLKRIASAAGLTGVMLLVMAADHRFQSTRGFFVLWGLIAGIALYEFFSMARGSGFIPFTAFGVALGVTVALAPLPNSVTLLSATTLGDSWVAITFALAIGFDLQRRRALKAPVVDRRSVGITLAGIGWIGLLGAYMTKVRLLHTGPETWKAEALLLLIVMVAKLNDTTAYFAGRRFGRHKLAPSISPGKTREGAVAGLAASMVVAGVGSFWIPSPTFLPLGPALLFGLLVGLASQAGDLAESWYKRKMGAKDSGHLLPNYGGLFDVADALLFAVPTAYYLLLWLR